MGEGGGVGGVGGEGGLQWECLGVHFQIKFGCVWGGRRFKKCSRVRRFIVTCSYINLVP